MATHKPYSVVVVGAGRIGSKWDSPRSREVYTHAHAFSTNPKTKLLAIVDLDDALGKREAKKWGVAHIKTLKEACAQKTPDIIVIATPDHTHAALLREAISYKPKLIICEKPVVQSTKDIAGLKRLAVKVPVIVDMTQRFDAVVAKLQNDLRAGRYGKVLGATALYTKGALHNGSHVIDLARFFFGEVKKVVPLHREQDWNGEPTVGAFVTLQRCPQLYVMAGHEEVYSNREFDVFTEKKRFRLMQDGLLILQQDVIPDPRFPEYKLLGEPRIMETKLKGAIKALSQHAVRVIEKKEKSRCTLLDGIKTVEACSKLLEPITM